MMMMIIIIIRADNNTSLHYIGLPLITVCAIFKITFYVV